MQLQMGGKGNAGIKGGGSGDLLISIEETPHEHFQRDGMNVHHETFINFADAALGTSIEVPTLDVGFVSKYHKVRKVAKYLG